MSALKKEKIIKHWYRLDNAAKLYPAIRSWKWSSMFRISALLREPVDPAVLQQALGLIMRRFPGFSVRLRAGFFWYYLEDNPATPRVTPDTVNPCVHIPRGENSGYMFRTRYFGRRIALEVFHSLADGGGGLAFFKTLLAQYLRLLGADIPCTDGVLDIEEPPLPEEMEDGFQKYATLNVLKSRKETRAFHVRGTAEPRFALNIVTGILPLDACLKAAKARGVSLTEYLTAALLFALYCIQEESPKKRPVKVSVPVNMRNFYPSQTLRNFSLFVNPGIDPAYGAYSFEEILRLTHHFLRYEINEKFLNAQMSKNVSSERNLAVRLMPLFMKNIVLSLVYDLVGESRVTSTLSNLGGVTLPEAMRPYIDRFDILLGPGKTENVNAAVISFNNKLSISFTRTIQEPTVERAFFTFLVREGLPVEVESNGG